MPLHRLSSSPASVGGMSKRIRLYPPGGRNPQDGGAVPPSPLFTVWGNLRAATGTELDKGQSIAQECRHIVRIPYRLGVKGDMTAAYENRTFQINYIEDMDEMHIFLDLYCTETGQNAGSQS